MLTSMELVSSGRWKEMLWADLTSGANWRDDLENFRVEDSSTSRVDLLLVL